MGFPLLKGASEPGSETLGGKSPSLILPQLPLLWSDASDHSPLGVPLSGMSSETAAAATQWQCGP